MTLHDLEFRVSIELEEDEDCGHWAWREAETDTEWSTHFDTAEEALDDARFYFQTALEQA